MKYTDLTIDLKISDRSKYDDPSKLVLRANTGSTIVLRGDDGTLEIKCHDFAATAWGIHTNRLFFQRRLGISSDYCSDFDGGGDQSVSIGLGRPSEKNYLIKVIYSSFGHREWIYEADQIMDGPKDYLPSKNRGRTKFGAEIAFLNVVGSEELLHWMNENYLPWMKELSRLSRPHSTMLEWVESELDMGVRCSDLTCKNGLKVLSNVDLRDCLADGASLESLRERLTCSKCGRRNPDVTPLLA